MLYFEIDRVSRPDALRIWKERNRRTFEDLDSSSDQMLASFSGTLFDWSRTWGLTSSDSLPSFLCSLSFLLFFFCLVFLCFSLFSFSCFSQFALCSSCIELPYLYIYIYIYISFLLIKKEKRVSRPKIYWVFLVLRHIGLIVLFSLSLFSFFLTTPNQDLPLTYQKPKSPTYFLYQITINKYKYLKKKKKLIEP